MKNFSDEYFTDAGNVYQSIKAPSALRERVLAAAESAQAELPGAAASAQKAAQNAGTETAPRKKAKGRILQIASVAACLAIMAAALPDGQADMDQIPEAGAPGKARMISEEAGLPGQAAYDPSADGSLSAETGQAQGPLEYLESQIPAIFGSSADLEKMAAVVVSQDDTRCTAEVTTEESITMEVLLEKNEETGCWEVTSVKGKEE